MKGYTQRSSYQCIKINEYSKKAKQCPKKFFIHRRYSEFYALHKDLLKKDRLVASFDFPPKKTVSNKAEKFVEDRKKKLQS